METFNYVKAPSVEKALASAQQAKFIAGGTTLVDLMKLNVEAPKTLVDINLLPLDKVEKLPDGGLRIGAMVRNSDLAWNDEVKKSYETQGWNVWWVQQYSNPNNRISYWRLADFLVSEFDCIDQLVAPVGTGASSCHSFQACEKDVQCEGLDYVIIRAKIQAVDDVPVRIASRQHQDRRV